MKNLLVLTLFTFICSPILLSAQNSNHFSVNVLAPLGTKKHIGLTYRRELGKHLGFQFTVFNNFNLGNRIIKNDEFVPSFNYQYQKGWKNMGGEVTIFLFKNRLGLFGGYEQLHVLKNERFCIDPIDLGNGFKDCAEIVQLEYKDRVHLLQTGLRYIFPVISDPVDISFHLRPALSFFWNDTQSQLPNGNEQEGRSVAYHTAGDWNNHLLFNDRGTFFQIKLECHVGISW